MSIEQAEHIYMAWQVGLLRDEDSHKLAEAVLILGSQPQEDPQ